MKNILYVNATVRKESRTDELARYLLKGLQGEVTELKLEDENIKPLNEETLAERIEILNNNNYENEKLKYARQFANADIIVIAAPFWDLSFPASLKAYIENICAVGVTFKYSETGIPIGLCKATDIHFVTTAGGKFLPNFGYDYIKTLSNELFGIKRSELFYAEGLDIVGNDIQKIMNNVKKSIYKKLNLEHDLI